MLEILVTAVIVAGIAAGLTVLSCAMLSSRIRRAEERREAQQANLKIKKMVYNKEQEAANHEQDE